MVKVGALVLLEIGGMANSLAVEVPNLKAAVVYGRQPAVGDVPKMEIWYNCTTQALMKELMQGAKGSYEDSLKPAKTIDYICMKKVNPTFHNDTSAARYNEVAAKWQQND
jgi:carboxymethylenebutenolidase